VRLHARVPVAPPAMNEELRHRSALDPSRRSGEYDAQKGEEVVTIWRDPSGTLARLRRRPEGREFRPRYKLDGMQRGLRLLCSLSLAAFLAGCGATAEHAGSAKKSAGVIPDPRRVAAPVAAAAVVSRCRSGASRPVGSPAVTVVAVVRGRARAFRRPGREALASFGRLNQNGYPTVFRVLAAVRARSCRPAWYRVQLPRRPNGANGYVRARAVDLATVRTKIVIDVSAHSLTFRRGSRPVLRTTVAVGAPATPTPTGRYYVNQKLVPVDGSGPFGPGALGISAFSPVLTGWAQGGPVAIHGTNEPWSIGHSVSNGCIRVQNPVLRRLFAATPAGTPVLIHR
jgi:lipoprotein-anchoring transpeptidase ErfK/SrfK